MKKITWQGVQFTTTELHYMRRIRFGPYGWHSMVLGDVDYFDVLHTITQPQYLILINKKGGEDKQNLVHHRTNDLGGLNVVAHAYTPFRVEAVFYDDTAEGKNMMHRLCGGPDSPYTGVHVFDPQSYIASQDSPGEGRTES